VDGVLDGTESDVVSLDIEGLHEGVFACAKDMSLGVRVEVALSHTVAEVAHARRVRTMGCVVWQAEGELTVGCVEGFCADFLNGLDHCRSGR
jgi:hypothetical protein